ncbi:MAG: glycosyltransferase [Calditrichia bacterium]
MKILFTANDLGGGMGHVRRSRMLAKTLQKLGAEVAFLVHTDKALQHLSPDFTVYQETFPMEKWEIFLKSKISPIHPIPEDPSKNNPFFWEFNSLNYQVLRDGYFTSGITERRFRQLKKIVEEFKPDIMINDGHLLAYFLRRFFQIPLVQIVRFAVFPENPQLLWWKTPPEGLQPPGAMAAFQGLFRQIKESPAEEACCLLKGDGYLIPADGEVEPVQTNAPHLFLGYHVDSDWDPRLLDVDTKPRLKKVFVTIGAGAQRNRVASFYQFLVNTLKDESLQVIFSDPFQVLSQDFQKQKYPQISVYKWIESSTVFPYLHLVIHHGGYSTTLEALWWGVPSLVLPFHSEQEGNGRRLQRLNAGEIVNVANTPYDPVWFRSSFGRYSLMGGFDFALTEDKLKDKIHQILSDNTYKNKAEEQSKKLKSQFNPAKIGSFIGQFV